MSDPVTGLKGAHFTGDISVTDAGLIGMISIRGDFNAPAFRNAVAAVTGHAVPETRAISGDATGGLAWMSPDELLYFCSYAEAPSKADALSDQLTGTHHMVAVISDARAVFRLSGAGVRDVLAKGAPVDLDPARMGAGEIRRTRLGQVAVAFWFAERDVVELVCFRSVAGFVMDWFEVTAHAGSEVGFHG
ncbi:sarcosine oxidase subunit gamma [Pontivivens insulae]|uniref:Sarcosine oxidase subunit gamma n=1 Tax=Pontivivens insulae TaxID=1639689 RepID=A0A2R8AA14_9RHOB|nr:sarcosine oxidase subunit gamma family protein [Pontivivens insulae]RED12807.1 heterotetrameric sarcosine oxidase gamma subunit [Pontivivens insulae]SPF28898.1 hypothetical protein POI8812_01201 [Pontivivens insulae]